MEEFLRTFVAIKLPEDFRNQIYREFSRFNWKDYKPVRPENIHLTLKFLGKTKKSTLEEIRSRLKKIAAGIQKFSFEIDDFGTFPEKRRARVLWVGLKTVPEELKILNKKIEDEMSRLGFEKEGREYVPHITIGRFRRPQSAEKDFEELKYLVERMKTSVYVDSFYLIESTLTPAGPIYDDLSKFNLK